MWRLVMSSTNSLWVSILRALLKAGTTRAANIGLAMMIPSCVSVVFCARRLSWFELGVVGRNYQSEFKTWIFPLSLTSLTDSLKTTSQIASGSYPSHLQELGQTGLVLPLCWNRKVAHHQYPGHRSQPFHFCQLLP